MLYLCHNSCSGARIDESISRSGFNANETCIADLLDCPAGLPSDDMDNDRYNVRKEEDELSMRMRHFLARLSDNPTTDSSILNLPCSAHSLESSTSSWSNVLHL